MLIIVINVTIIIDVVTFAYIENVDVPMEGRPASDALILSRISVVAGDVAPRALEYVALHHGTVGEQRGARVI